MELKKQPEAYHHYPYDARSLEHRATSLMSSMAVVPKQIVANDAADAGTKGQPSNCPCYSYWHALLSPLAFAYLPPLIKLVV